MQIQRLSLPIAFYYFPPVGKTIQNHFAALLVFKLKIVISDTYPL
jgi:hypothetical protein